MVKLPGAVSDMTDDQMDESLGGLESSDSPLRASVFNAQSANRELAGRASVVGREMGVPADMAERNIEALERERSLEAFDFDALESQHPLLSDYLSDANNAKLFSDEVGFWTGAGDYMGSFAGQGLGRTIGSGLTGTGYYAQKADQKLGELTGASGLPMDTNTALLRMYLKLFSDVASPLGEAIKKGGEYIEPPEERKTFGTEVAGGVGQAGGNIILSLVPGLGPAAMFGQGVDQQKERMDAEGIPEDQRSFMALTAGGATTMATEMIEAKFLLGGLRKIPGVGNSELLQTMTGLADKLPGPLKSKWAARLGGLGGAAMAEAGQEVLEGFLQDLIEYTAYNPDVDWMKDWEEQASVAGASGLITKGIVMGVTSIGRSSAHVRGDIEKAGTVSAEIQAMRAVAQQARQGQSVKRDPVKFQELMTALNQNGHEVYVTPETALALEQSGVDFTDMLRISPDIGAKLNEALATGADVAVPVDRLIGLTSQTDQYDAIFEHIRTAPDGPTLFEAQRTVTDEDAANERIREILDEERARMDESDLDRQGLEDFEQVQQRIYNQLVNTGRETAATARDQAQLIGRIYETLASRTESAPLAQRLRSRFDNIEAFGPRPAFRYRPDEFDVLIDQAKRRARQQYSRQTAQESAAGRDKNLFGEANKKVRKGKAAPTPVINFLAQRGGVLRGSPFASELENMGITPKSYPRLFRKDGKRDLDALPAEEFNQQFDDRGLVAAEDGNGYVDTDWLMEQLRRESFGEGADTFENQQRAAQLEYLDHLLGILDRQGVDILGARNADIKAALGQYARDNAPRPFEGRQEPVVEPDLTQREQETLADIEAEQESPPEFKPEEKPAPLDEQVAQEEQAEAPAAQKDAPADEIKDFGEKIAGARKDLWQDYKQAITEELPEDAKDIKLSKHFPEPDYQAMIDAGVDVQVLAAIKAMRDEIPSKPQKAWKLKQWAGQVKTVRDFANDMLEGSVPMDKVMHAMRTGGYGLRGIAERIELYTALGYPAFTKATGWSMGLAKFSVYNGVPFSPAKEMWSVAKKGDFGQAFETREEGIAWLRAKLETEPSNQPKTTKLDIYQVTKTGEIIIGKKVGAGKFLDLKGGFTSVKEARTFLRENEKVLLALLEKKKDVRPERRSTNDPRRGQDYRLGENVTPEKFANEFGFRGVQFGNYVEQAKRAKDLNNSYDALLDLANLLGVPSQALSLNGTLGLAFGARGSGGKGAPSAHFEPGQVVINLTKRGGAGSLGHEWWHALDNFFGKQESGRDFMTANPTARKMNKDGTPVLTPPVRPEVTEAFKGVMDAIKASGLRARSKELDKRRTKDYWSTDIEMSARAFEAYLIRKAAGKGESNDYLANIVPEEAHKALNEQAGDNEPFPYPTAEEMETIGPAFDRLFQTLETRQTGRGLELFQEDGVGPRGSTVFLEDGAGNVRTIIQLFETSNRSTFLHESGHFFLDLMADVFTDPSAPAQMKADWQATLDWFKANGQDIHKEAMGQRAFAVQHDADSGKYFSIGWDGSRVEHGTRAEAQADADAKNAAAREALRARDGEAAVQQFVDGGYKPKDAADYLLYRATHEQFARGFEAYLFKGEAPSLEVRSIFETFKAWLQRVYRYAIENLRVDVSPEMKGVFDRLVATDAQIEEARASMPIFRPDPATLEMLNAQEREDYLKINERAMQNARNKLFRKAMRQHERKATQWYKEERAKVRAEQEAILDDSPLWRAVEFFKTGKGPDGTVIMAEGFKLDRKAIAAEFGAELLKYLPKGVTNAKAGGLNPAVAAEMFGYPNASAMIRAMTGLDTRKNTIERMTDEEMVRRHGDMLIDGTLEREALEALMAENPAAQAYELKALSQKTGAEYPSDGDFKRAAAELLASKKVDDAIKPDQYLRAALRARGQYAKMAERKDYDKAAVAKRQELLNRHAYKQAVEARENVQKALDHFAVLARKPKKQKKLAMDADYRDKILELLGSVNLAPRISAARRLKLELAAINEWIREKQDNDAAQLQMPPELEAADGLTHYRDMTLEEFMAFRDLVYNIEKQGRKKQELIVEGKRRQLAEDAEAAAEIIYKNNDVREQPIDPQRARDENLLERGKALANSLVNISRKAETLIEKLDGGKTKGFIWERLRGGVFEGELKEQVMRREAAEKLNEITFKHFGKMTLELPGGKKYDVAAEDLTSKKTQVWINAHIGYMTREQIIMAVLNMGNRDNKEKLRDGRKGKDGQPWTDEDIDAIKDAARKQDLDFAQDVWDMIDGYWPEIYKLQRERLGYAPEKIEAEALETKHGTYKGGYFRLKYDGMLSARVAETDVTGMAKELMMGTLSGTQTRRGFTHERKAGVARPVKLHLSVINQHLNEVIHDLALGEATYNAMKFLRHPKMMEAVTDTHGVEGFEALEMWLMDTAAGGLAASSDMDRLQAGMRHTMTMSSLALKYSTIAVQLTGFANTVVEIRPRWALAGLARYIQLRGPFGAGSRVAEISEYMRERPRLINRDVAASIRKLEKGGAWSDAQTAALAPMLRMQYIVDTVTWLGAYERAQAEGLKDKEAIRFADLAVDRAQGSSFISSLSAPERGTTGKMSRLQEANKTWTIFMSYFNAKLNVAMRRTDAFKAAGGIKNPFAVATLGMDYLVLFWLEYALGEMILGRIPDFEDEDEPFWSFIKWVFGGAMTTAASGVLFLRDAAGVLQGFNAQPASARGLQSIGQAAGQLGRTGAQVWSGDDELNWYKAGKAAVTLGNFASPVKYPAGQINVLLDAMDDASRGEDVSPLDYLRYDPNK